MLFALALAVVALSACGGSKRITSDAAVVAGQPVSRADVTAYVRYAYSFYRSTSGAAAGDACSRPRTLAVCSTLSRQALGRLLEEKVVSAFARRHGLGLDATQRAAVAGQLRALQNNDLTTRHLIRSHTVTSGFLQQLLETEALVRKVERAVTTPQANRGFSYHIHMYAFPFNGSGDASRTYRTAERLATDGKPVPVTAIQHVRWVAAFRLAPALAVSLPAANDGEFVGPFRQSGHYLVVQLLRSGIHAYGGPAHQEVETRLFKRWLASQLRIAAPRCYSASSASIPCPRVEQ